MSQRFLPWLAVLLICSVSCQDQESKAPRSRLDAFCSCRPGTEQKRHYRLWVQEQPAGRAWQEICDCRQPAGQRLLKGSQSMTFSRAGRRVELQANYLRQLGARGEPVRLRIRNRQLGAEASLVEAQRSGDHMQVWKQGQVYDLPWEAEAIDEDGLVLWLKAAHLQPGRKQVLRVFSLEQGQYSDWGLELLEKQAHGRSIILVHPGTAKGMRMWLHLDPEGWPAETRIQLGRMRIRTMQVEESQARQAISPPELSPMFRSGTKGSIAHPDQLRWARYRLRHLPEDVTPEQLAGPGQRVLESGAPDALDIRVSQLPLPATAKSAHRPPAHYLEDSPLLGLRDPDIRQQAGRLHLEGADRWTQALRLRNWVREEIQGDMGMNYLSAPNALRKKRGDCSEKSLLLTALARASGIPARAVGGLVYADGSFNGHMWTEIWTASGWRPLDASFGPSQVSAARIRLEEVDLRLREVNRIGLAARILAQGLQVEILETSEGGQGRPTSSSPSSP